MNWRQVEHRCSGKHSRWIAVGIACILSVVAISGLTAEAHSFDLKEALAAAQPGDTIAVPAGIYAGPLEIARPVTLQAEGGAILDGGGQGHVLVIAAPDVTIHGFVIRNSGTSLDREHSGVLVEAPRATITDNRLEDVLFGLYLKNAPGSILRGNTIYSKDLDIARRGDGIKVWHSAHCLIDGNRVSGSRDVLVWYSPGCTVQRNIVEHSRYGIHLMNSDEQIVANNLLRNNSVGVYVMYGHSILLRENMLYAHRGPSGYAIGLKDAVNVTVQGNRAVGNRVGVYIDNAPRDAAAVARFTGNLWAYNEIGVELLPNLRHTVFASNIFLENTEQVAVAGGGDALANQWSLDGRGNYWSDYTGFDADGDNIGDTPYRAHRLFEDLVQQHPALRLFQLSPTAAALDLAARAFPIFQPRTKLEDEHPLVMPPELPPFVEAPASPVVVHLAAPFAMIGLAVVILASAASCYQQKVNGDRRQRGKPVNVPVHLP